MAGDVLSKLLQPYPLLSSQYFDAVIIGTHDGVEHGCLLNVFINYVLVCILVKLRSFLL